MLHEPRYCPVLVGLRKRWMPCGLPASHAVDQDGIRRYICTLHARFRGRLPFRPHEL